MIKTYGKLSKMYKCTNYILREISTLIDKVSKNIVFFVCKAHYLNSLIKELDIDSNS